MSDNNTYECYICSAEFDVQYEDKDFEVKFCPNCGNELMGKIELVDDIDPDMIYDDLDEL